MTDFDVRGVLVVLGVALLIGLPVVWVQTGGELDNADTFGPHTDDETTVTCYKYVENGSAEVVCPDKVQAPGWINITVKHCSEYEYANDEPHPCEPWRDDDRHL